MPLGFYYRAKDMWSCPVQTIFMMSVKTVFARADCYLRHGHVTPKHAAAVQLGRYTSHCIASETHTGYYYSR